MGAHNAIDAHAIEGRVSALPIISIVAPQHFTLPKLHRHRVCDNQSRHNLMLFLNGLGGQLLRPARDEPVGQDIRANGGKTGERRHAPVCTPLTFAAKRNPNAAYQRSPQPDIYDE